MSDPSDPEQTNQPMKPQTTGYSPGYVAKLPQLHPIAINDKSPKPSFRLTGVPGADQNAQGRGFVPLQVHRWSLQQPCANRVDPKLTAPSSHGHGQLPTAPADEQI